jgi:hypothetical protein
MHVQAQVRGLEAPRFTMCWRHGRMADVLACKFFCVPLKKIHWAAA